MRNEKKPTTACVLRLTEPLAGSGVILHGDSWFASLNTLQKLKQMGIYFVGLIKTAEAGEDSVGCASTSMHQECARRALKALICPSRSLTVLKSTCKRGSKPLSSAMEVTEQNPEFREIDCM